MIFIELIILYMKTIMLLSKLQESSRKIKEGLMQKTKSIIIRKIIIIIIREGITTIMKSKLIKILSELLNME